MSRTQRAVITDDGTKIQYQTAGTSGPLLLMIHGFPESSLAWRHTVEPLVTSGFRLVIPDLRGAGGSARPQAGYDKRTLAEDLLAVLNAEGYSESLHVVGHDIGSMVGYAFARLNPLRVASLTMMDSPLPGTTLFDETWNGSRAWHYHFFQAPDVPELLIQGREGPFLERFYHDLSMRGDAIDSATFQQYVRSFAQPGAIRAGLNLYRTFLRDRDDNRDVLKAEGKLAVPVLALSGEMSPYRDRLHSMMSEVAHNVLYATIRGAHHWLAEENPEAFLTELIPFITSTLTAGEITPNR